MDDMQVASDPVEGLLDMAFDIEGNLGDSWGDEFFNSERLAFDMTRDILEDAFDEAAVTWEKQIRDSEVKRDHDQYTHCPANLVQHKEHAESCRKEECATAKIRDTLCRAVKSGELTKQISKSLEEDRLSNVNQKLAEGLCAAASDGRLASIFKEISAQKPKLPQAPPALHTAEIQPAVQIARVKPAVQPAAAPPAAVQLAAAPPAAVQLAAAPPAAVQLAAASAPKFRTTCVASFKTQPIVVSTPTPCEASVATGLTDESISEVPQNVGRPPSSRGSTRSRRRVFGAVVRAPAVDDQEISEAQQPKRNSKSKRKEKKAMADTYNIDLSGGECSSNPCTRESSLVRGYNALGAKHYSLDADDAWLSFARGGAASSSTALGSKIKIKVSDFDASSAFERSTPKAGARLRTASMSAMAMDLGFAGASPANVRSSDAPKAKFHGGLLPMLPSTRKSVESIALTMQMSKTTSKWCNTGLRGSASAVF
jgi:hypothetical protein